MVAKWSGACHYLTYVPISDSGSCSSLSSVFCSQYPLQNQNLSTTSVASGASEYSNDYYAHAEDSCHVTQMHRIAAKPSISSKMIPRRLCRGHPSVMPSWGAKDVESTVIGVSIQEATVQSVCEEESDGDRRSGIVDHSRRASIVACGPSPLIQKQTTHNGLGSLGSHLSLETQTRCFGVFQIVDIVIPTPLSLHDRVVD